MGKHSRQFMGRMQLQFLKTAGVRYKNQLLVTQVVKCTKKKIRFYNYIFKVDMFCR